MLLAAFDPGKEMAIANFFLAIFCLFTIALPVLLITRGDKTVANRNFIAATVNPWSQIDKKVDLTPVVVTGFTPMTESQPELEVIIENSLEPISRSEKVISLKTNYSTEPEESSSSEQVLATKDEVIAA